MHDREREEREGGREGEREGGRPGREGGREGGSWGGRESERERGNFFASLEPWIRRCQHSSPSAPFGTMAARQTRSSKVPTHAA